MRWLSPALIDRVSSGAWQQWPLQLALGLIIASQQNFPAQLSWLASTESCLSVAMSLTCVESYVSSSVHTTPVLSRPWLCHYEGQPKIITLRYLLGIPGLCNATGSIKRSSQSCLVTAFAEGLPGLPVASMAGDSTVFVAAWNTMLHAMKALSGIVLPSVRGIGNKPVVKQRRSTKLWGS